VIDFSIPDELWDLVSGLRVYIKEEVLPAEGEILYPGDLGGRCSRVQPRSVAPGWQALQYA
jgi:hypothetical protein